MNDNAGGRVHQLVGADRRERDDRSGRSARRPVTHSAAALRFATTRRRRDRAHPSRSGTPARRRRVVEQVRLSRLERCALETDRRTASTSSDRGCCLRLTGQHRQRAARRPGPGDARRLAHQRSASRIIGWRVLHERKATRFEHPPKPCVNPADAADPASPVRWRTAPSGGSERSELGGSAQAQRIGLKRTRFGRAPSSPRRFFLSASYSW